MDFFIARQPIFTLHRRVYAYELLYRGPENAPLQSVGGDRATTSLLSSTFITEGIDNISNYKPCFINFTKNLLLKGVPYSFPNTQIVVEILEDVPADPDVLNACMKLREQGYTIALDDFVYDRSLEPLIEIAHIIKIDVIETPLDTIHRTLHRLSRFDLKFLAEKVETNEEFERAQKLGFVYFQGYFFRKPELIKIKELTALKINLLQLLAELGRSDWTVERLNTIINQDVSLTYKILRYLNSSYFYRLNEITSVSHAIAYLGEKEIRRFALLVIISEIATDKPGELFRLAMVRAKFCELLSESSSHKSNSSDMFILGLFSLLDVMLDMEMKSVLDKLPLGNIIKDGLLSHSGLYSSFLSFVLAYEQRDRDKCIEILKSIGPLQGKIHEKYLQALEFSSSLTSSTE